MKVKILILALPFINARLVGGRSLLIPFTLPKPDPLMLKITDPVDARLFLAEGKKWKKYRDMR